MAFTSPVFLPSSTDFAEVESEAYVPLHATLLAQLALV